jgi:hypothetical protein
LRRRLEAHAHGMEAEKDFGAGHGAIIRCPRMLLIQ